MKASTACHVPTSKHRVLLVEDNPGDADLIAEFLDRPDRVRKRVVHVDTLAGAGEQIARRRDFDIVLLDLRLPDGHGVDCVRAVRAWAPEVPIIVLTGMEEDVLSFACLAAGAQDYISKNEIRGRDLNRAIGYAIVRNREAVERRRADVLQQHLAAIVESSADAILSTDVDGIVASWNRGAERILGYSRKEAIGRRLDEVMRPVGSVPDPVPPPGSEPVEITQLRKDGTEVTLSVVSCNVRDEAGAVVHRAMICRDITESRIKAAELRSKNEALRKSEAQLRHAQKMEAVGRLAGGVAHDFNNLLMVILGYGEMSLDRIPDADPLHEMVAKMNEAASRAAKLTSQLLIFSRRQILKLQVVCVNDVILSLDRLLRRLIEASVDFVTVPGAHDARVRADRGQLEQVIVNLAVNARDAMPSGGTLTIETSMVSIEAGTTYGSPQLEAGDYVCIAVSDTGVGMNRDTMQQIFEPFFTTKDAGRGTGLGLSTAYGIVQQIGGSIGVYSEVGHGTTMRVYLPRTEESEPDVHVPEREPRHMTGSETVLVVEDETAVRKLVCGTLEDAGFAVLSASTGPEAIELYHASGRPIDLVLTDVVMPGMTGPELVARLQRDGASPRIVYMSGYATASVGGQVDLPPGATYLQKPFSGRTLLDRLRATLDD
jgi:PAS domain S-box-containing protein